MRKLWRLLCRRIRLDFKRWDYQHFLGLARLNYPSVDAIIALSEFSGDLEIPRIVPMEMDDKCLTAGHATLEALNNDMRNVIYMIENNAFHKVPYTPIEEYLVRDWVLPNNHKVSIHSVMTETPELIRALSGSLRSLSPEEKSPYNRRLYRISVGLNAWLSLIQ